jgi:hypothetical protein
MTTGSVNWGIVPFRIKLNYKPVGSPTVRAIRGRAA